MNPAIKEIIPRQLGHDWHDPKPHRHAKDAGGLQLMTPEEEIKLAETYVKTETVIIGINEKTGQPELGKQTVLVTE